MALGKLVTSLCLNFITWKGRLRSLNEVIRCKAFHRCFNFFLSFSVYSLHGFPSPDAPLATYSSWSVHHPPQAIHWVGGSLFHSSEEEEGSCLLCSCFPSGASGKDLTCQCQRHEAWVRSLGWEDPLEKDMATHASILAWRIPWTEEPGRVAKSRTRLKRLSTHTCSNVLITAQHSLQFTGPSQTYKILIILHFLSQMGKWRLRMVNVLAQGHPASPGPI